LPVDYATLLSEVTDQYKRVTSRKTYYDRAIAAAQTANDAADKAFKAAVAALGKNKADIKTATAAVETALADCKVVQYGKAQAQALKLKKQVEADAKTAATVKTAYDKLIADSQKPGVDTSKDAAKASSNKENYICAFPKKETGKDQAPRPLCAEGYCCGAAQRFMKDGTKMAVETCQKLGTHTYTYYPPLPAGATSAPSKQVWRFNCISGAQKLAAVATAALAASYMMA